MKHTINKVKFELKPPPGQTNDCTFTNTTDQFSKINMQCAQTV